MLNIKDLRVEVNGKEIIHKVNLEIKQGETHVLFGPNGSGKTTLLMTIMGFPGYKITGGSIEFKGKKINKIPLNERALMGIGLSFQRPPTIKGVKTAQMLELCNRQKQDISADIEYLNFNKFLDRGLNDGFSGGEIKKSEILQLIAQDPDLVLLDEPESGVDLENISLIGNSIVKILDREIRPHACVSQKEWHKIRKKSGLIITHTGHILDYINADIGHVMMNGESQCSGNPREMFRCIKEQGYTECIKCAV